MTIPGLLRLLSIRLRAVKATKSRLWNRRTKRWLSVLTRFQPRSGYHRSTHGQDGRHWAFEGITDALTGIARGHHHSARYDPRCGYRDAAWRVRFPDQTDRQRRTDVAWSIARFESSRAPLDVDEDWAAEIITRNQALKEVLQQAKMVAATDARVLLTGESGTGKELLAQAIHKASDQKAQQTVCRASTVVRWLRTFSSLNYLAMRREHLRVLPAVMKVCSSPQKVAP